MNGMTSVRKKLRRSLGQELPDSVWETPHMQGLAREYLEAITDEERETILGDLEEGAKERLGIWIDGRREALRSIRSGSYESSEDMRKADLENQVGTQKLDPGRLVGERTKAMTGAMSALFALIGDQDSEIRKYRERVLLGRFLSGDEAHALIASYAARTLSLDWFEKWSIPFVGHRAEVLDYGPYGEDHASNSVLSSIWRDDRITIRVNPPGVTKTIRYAKLRKRAPNTRYCAREGAVMPIHVLLPIEDHGHHRYPGWLWPGSVVDKLFDLSVNLAEAFDWPVGFEENLTGTRRWCRTAAWFVLTGKAPEVDPIDARWQEQQSPIYIDRQWCIQLSMPPWLPEEEVLRALRTLRRLRPKGHQMPKTTKPLEVARFVWERERLHEHGKPRPWTAWWKEWNDEHPGDRIKTAGNFCTYFVRGEAAVKHLNFDWPNTKRPYYNPDTTTSVKLRTTRHGGDEKNA